MSKSTDKRDIIVIGGSAGALEPLKVIVSQLPADLPAAVMVVIHMSQTAGSLLPQILARVSNLPVIAAEDGMPMTLGRVHVARPGHHLLLERGIVRVTSGPKENGHRPSVDTLFRTAAVTYGPRVIGVVLSGALDDGAYGTSLIREMKGEVVVQQPDDALVPNMPYSAIAASAPDYIVDASEIASLLASLVKHGSTESPAHGDFHNLHHSALGDVFRRPDVSLVGTKALKEPILNGPPSAFSCPECGGALWEVEDNNVVRYRCHVGHGYTFDTLTFHHDRRLEAALWHALRALEEQAAMRRKMAARATAGHMSEISMRFSDQATTAETHAEVLREVLLSQSSPGE